MANANYHFLCMINLCKYIISFHPFPFLCNYTTTKTKNYVATAVEKPKPSGNPCIPNPCGPNSQCRSVGDTPACSCLPNYVGRSPNCRPECVISAECPSTLACINERCSDPCIGACGVHTICTVLNHNSVCQCEPGYTGDPFSSCREMPKCKTFSLECYSIFLYFTHSLSVYLSFSHFIHHA